MSKGAALEQHTVRLFADDIREIKRLGAVTRTPWQQELRQLVHRALKGERREFFVVKERT